MTGLFPALLQVERKSHVNSSHNKTALSAQSSTGGEAHEALEAHEVHEVHEAQGPNDLLDVCDMPDLMDDDGEPDEAAAMALVAKGTRDSLNTQYPQSQYPFNTHHLNTIKPK